MKTVFYIFIVAAVTACTSEKSNNYDTIISNVSLVDGTGAPMENHVNIYITGGKIHKIDAVKVNLSGDNIIDGTGKYLIPGLFDCHAHTANYRYDFPRFMHFGVTSIFVPGGSTCTNDYYAEMRALGEQDSLPAPRVFHTSQHFTMEGRHPVKTYASSNWIEGESVFFLRDTLQIESLVKQVARFPIAGVKLTIEDGPAPPFVERMPQEFINKVQREAERNGLEVFAHVSDNIELAMAIEAGIQNIIHFVGVDLDWERDQKLADSIYNSNISWVTTLMLDKSFLYALHPEWLQKSEIIEIYDPKEIEKLKGPVYIKRAKEFLDRMKNYFGVDNPNLENIITPEVQDIKILYKNGVNMVLGTDTGNDFIFPGYSLHEEMQLMELGGFKPLNIIKMCSHNAAKMLKVLETHGTIETGKFADMILLDQNPLESISNTLAINKVFKNGKVQKRIN